MFSKITSFISASLRSLITPRRELAEGKAHAAVPSKRSREARGAHPPVKKRRRQSQVRFSTSRKNQVVHYSPSPVPSEIPLSPPLQHMSAEQRRAYAAGEVVVKEEPEDDVNASPPRPKSHLKAPHPAQEGGRTRSGRRVNRPKFFSPGGEMVPSDTNKYVVVLSDSESD
ncbi:hypothetical protein FOZ62_002450 [Perkinsus olseni]|uniref:Uncharacterized protein n=1 Tax=Perkinsus olseni TaxID=32597 RepID=A0A7J6UDW3_PEROL|nr:hypothetical protein FOZ62_002450 [Perkinsus olseni]